MSIPLESPAGLLEGLLALSLDEDIGAGDLTTLATVEPGLAARATIVSREQGIVAGMALLEPLLAELRGRERPQEEAATVAVARASEDGQAISAGDTVLELSGTARALLVLERTLLNYLSRLCGIATLTSAFVMKVRETGSAARVLDTRKTLPGHRVLDKYAVRCGGGDNHRAGLYDAVLIKENHIAAAGGIAAAIARARAAADGRLLECECEGLGELREALEAGTDAVLLDNFTPELVREAVALVGGRARVEVSGGISLMTVADFARAGADDISVGAITHSAPSLDLSMAIETGD